MSATARWRAEVVPAANLLLVGLALWALDRVMHDYPVHDVLAALRAIPFSRVVLAALISALGYLALIGYDFVAFRFIGLGLPLRRMLIPSFVSFAVSNSAPASMVTAGGVRYRMYRSLGLTATGAVTVAGFNVVTYALGLAALAGVALLLDPTAAALTPGLALPGRGLGVLLLVGAAGYLLLAGLGRSSVRVLGRTLRLPGMRLALAQLGTSVADWLLSSAPLFVLLSSDAPVPYFAFLATFLVAAFATLLLPIPGGIGVFEAVVLLLRPSGAPAPQTLAALVVYRVLYYLLPLATAGGLLAARALQRIRRSERPLRELMRGMSSLAPRALAITTFLAGIVLLAKGAIPADDRRLAWLGQLLPLTVIEASHFLSSIVGTVLVLSAWGLERRSHVAYHLVRILFGLGILLTLLHSYDLRVAAFLAIALVILVLMAREFPRPEPLAHQPMGPRWVFAASAVFLVEAWVGVLLYRHIEFSGEVWWHFALFGQGSRALRAVVGASIVMLLFALERLISGTAPRGPRTEEPQ
ncbi:MAG TPA: lysylphosphatidylglycerol synthase domain-containing protein [Gemmatimonadales bacterium]|nr:lysylphosphatidylglycerol synthase domain-containing protein [Gemmatimonadales bacterium]